MNNTTDRARQALLAWQESQPDNFFTVSRQLQRILARRWPNALYEARKPHLERFGAVSAGKLDQAAVLNNENENLPRVDRWSPLGARTEEIRNHPAYEICGEAIYRDGRLIAAYGEEARNLYAQALFYISSHAGEAGHNCPVACTAGIVKSLQAAGSEDLRGRWLPGLLDDSWPGRLDGAQFLTEVQGGSDVGANSVRAEPDGEAFGTTRWRISGEKWFCSNAAADLILMTARVDPGSEGTGGLGLFLVPRLLDDGSPNHFALRRLKDKIGTRSMPSGEMDFEGAVGYAVGPVEQGFRNVMKYVITTSRLYNTVGCAGIARRASLVAAGYARYREAFGQPILRFPLVQEMLAGLTATERALTAGALELAWLADEEETGRADAETKAFLRVATNLSKMRSCQHSHRAVLTAIETLGGNGAIETFSVLPRLLRDNVVYENWEGTHNVLLAQSVRDFGRLRLHEGFLERLEQLLAVDDAAISEALEPARAALGRGKAAIAELSGQKDPGVAGLILRPHAEALADCFFAAAYARDIECEGDQAHREAEIATLRHYVDLNLGSPARGVDDDYVRRVRAIAEP